MNIVGVKSTEPRFDTVEVANLDIQAYGQDNLYPDAIRRVISASQTAKVCAKRYARFIEGGGFANAELYGYVVNDAEETMDDILKAATSDFATFGGFALHVNYNVLGQAVSLSHIPFEHCRIGMPDDSGYVSKIAVHPDWSGKTKRNGKALKPSATTVDYIDVFNPLKPVVAAQIEAAGGIEAYKGQVVYVSADGALIYPTPTADSIVTEMSTDEGLSNVRYRNVRHNFLPAGMIVRKKDSEYSEEGSQAFVDGIKKFQGDTNGSKMFVVEIEGEEEAPEFKPFEAKNYDSEFDSTNTTTIERIYSAYEQEVFLRIRQGQLGFSSDVMKQAYEYYANLVLSEQQLIERTMKAIFEAWHTFVSDDFSIAPLQYRSVSFGSSEKLIALYEKGVITLNELLVNVGMQIRDDGDKYISDMEDTPLAVRLGVGGTQALQGVLTDANLPNESKVSVLMILFSITETDAQRMVYGNKGAL